MTHPLTEVREALAQMLGAIDANAIDSPHVRHAQTGEDTHKWHEEWEQRGKQALATLDRFIAGQDMPRVTYVQLTDKGLIRKWQDKPFDDGVLYVRADVQGWQDISSAPKDGTRIIGWSPTYKRPFICWWKEMENCWESYGTAIFDENGEHVTHWQPLPPPPEIA